MATLVTAGAPLEMVTRLESTSVPASTPSSGVTVQKTSSSRLNQVPSRVLPSPVRVTPATLQETSATTASPSTSLVAPGVQVRVSDSLAGSGVSVALATSGAVLSMTSSASPTAPSCTPSLGVTVIFQVSPRAVAEAARADEVDAVEGAPSTDQAQVRVTGSPSGSTLSVVIVATRSSLVTAGSGDRTTTGAEGRPLTANEVAAWA